MSRLTETENKAILALKKACDTEGIPYDNAFQLFKYVLVVQSSFPDTPKDPDKAETLRLKAALKRLRKRVAWLERHGLQKINGKDALLEINELSPDFFLSHYTTDKQGRVIVAHHKAYPPTKYISTSPQNKAKFLAAEQFRLDLAAADIDEARRGIAMVTITDGQLTYHRAFHYLRMCAAIAMESDMNMHRIKQVYSQVPPSLVRLVEPTTLLLPSKIASRISLFGTMEELHLQVNRQPEKHEAPLSEWIDERMKKYEATIADFHNKYN